VWPLSAVQTQAIDRGILRDRQRGRLRASLQHRSLSACRDHSARSSETAETIHSRSLGACFRRGPATPASASRRSMRVRRRSLLNQPSGMPSRAVGACFLRTGSLSGGAAGKISSHSTLGCRTIVYSHLPGCGIDGETPPALSLSLARL